jgi:hypothetical protein
VFTPKTPPRGHREPSGLYVLVGLRTNAPAKGKGLRFRSSSGAHALPMPSNSLMRPVRLAHL